MEIITLRFVVTEDDLNGLLIRFVAIPRKVRDLHLRVTPDGLSLAGVYQTILPIPFNTEWRIVVEAGKLVARLSGMKAVGVGLGFLKGYVLKAVSSSSTLIELKGDRLEFDVDRSLDKMAVPIKTNLQSVCCDNRRLVIDCGRRMDDE